ncbi:hypothetical protein [Roseovarius nanhaiticus]|uniref:hypothetical protein n=1 Tax=Roseovarius nanhaiticus TaxID=573024 RepID=UPI00267BD3E3
MTGGDGFEGGREIGEGLDAFDADSPLRQIIGDPIAASDAFVQGQSVNFNIISAERVSDGRGFKFLTDIVVMYLQNSDP